MALSRNGLSENEVRQHALAKLAQADPKKNPVSYVIGAFRTEHLDRLRPAGTYEPLADESLSLPEDGSSETGTDTASAPESHGSEPATKQQSSEANEEPEQQPADPAVVRAHSNAFREQRHWANVERMRRKHGGRPDQESA